MLHRDRVRVRIVRYDRKGRPEGRVLEILERSKAPIIGRLLHESGIWLVAPEDKRYGQDILIPKNATAERQGRPGGRDRADRAAVDVLAAGRPRHRGARRDRRSRHGDRDRGAQVRGAAPSSRPRRWRRPRRCPTRSAPADRKHRIDLTDVPLVTIDGEDARDFDDAVYCEPAKVGRGKGWRLVRRDRRRQPLREAGRAARRRRLRARHLGLLPAPRDPDAAGEALERPVLAESRTSTAWRWSATCWSRADGEIHAYQFYPAVIRSHGALHLHRGGGDPRQHARPRGGAARARWCRTCSTCTRSTARC